MMKGNVEMEKKEVGSTHVVQAPSSQTHRREKQMLRKRREQLWRSGG